MNCPFASYEHIDCGERSECHRKEKHHHHLSPRTVEIISPGSGESCFQGWMRS